MTADSTDATIPALAAVAGISRVDRVHVYGPGGAQPALDLPLISRHVERVGDHATNIAEEAIFIRTRRATSRTRRRRTHRLGSAGKRDV
jgi:phosphate uptake regulator